jgi:hypothetical protein
LQTEINLLRLQVRSALMANDASSQTISELIIVVNQHGDTISQLHDVVHAQAGYIERLDDLWHHHMLELAAEDVYSAFLGKDEPAPCDVLQVDLWRDESIVRRVN